MADLTPKLVAIQDIVTGSATGGNTKVKHITYMVGTYGPFYDDIPDSANWQSDARTKMQAQANALLALGVS